MRKGFTLIEMLVVVAIIVSLMAMVFKIGSIAGDSEARSKTVVRIQRVENCLSGYYAAFGSYPPVALHGTRDFTMGVDDHGIQDDSSGVDVYTGDENKAWNQVETACRSQPVACNFPFPEGYTDYIKSISDEAAKLAQEHDEDFPNLWKNESVYNRLTARFDIGYTGNGLGRFASKKNLSDWRNIQVFRFGLMSYLLPRYLVMMNGSHAFFADDFMPWGANNVIPCDPFTGDELQWDTMKEISEAPNNKSEYARLANIPSQAICARWMPNLAGICACNHAVTLFGVDIRDDDPYSVASYLGVQYADQIPIYTPNGSGNTDQYVLDGITVRDGWYHDLYYYSPAPYQSYTLWSAGPNGKTFPPWVSRSKLNSQQLKRVNSWVEDDIVHLSN